jgi:hypothetical protein
MNRSTLALALILTTAASGAEAATSDADMLRCAALAARDARLDCYDALALAARPATPAAAQDAATSPVASTSPVAAASPVTAAAVAPPAAVVPAANAPSSLPPAADPKNFGLTAAQQHTLDVGPQLITATISALGSNQKGETFVTLDNGQSWSVADNDGWIATGQAVKIKKAAMGSFLMLLPSNHSYHVRRLK